MVDKLLYCDRENEYAVLIADAREKIGGFADGGLRDMHTAVMEEIVARRLLARSTKFTNCWNSQSAAESMNAVMKRVGVGADMSLPIVLDKLIDHMERQERATDAWKPAALQSQEAKYIGALQEHITQKAFKEVRKQYDSAVHLDCVQASDSSYTVRSSLSDKEPRAVQKTQDGAWKCSCNMAVYKGIVCRHQIAVLLTLKTAVSLPMIDGRWWRNLRQPAVPLANASPFSERMLTQKQLASPTKGMLAEWNLLNR